MEKLKEIIRKNGMCTRPEYYSGRGATISDLNSKILFGIHRDIKQVFGDAAGVGFVSMIDGINVLSATAFLNGLYELFYNNWEYTDNQNQPASISVDKNEDGTYNVDIGMIGVMEVMFRSSIDDTQRIKSHFLYSNGAKDYTKPCIVYFS